MYSAGPLPTYGPDYTSFDDGRLLGGFRKADVVGSASPLVVLFAADLEAMLSEVNLRSGIITRDIFEFPGGRRCHFVEPGEKELAVWSK